MAEYEVDQANDHHVHYKPVDDASSVFGPGISDFTHHEAYLHRHHRDDHDQDDDAVDFIINPVNDNLLLDLGQELRFEQVVLVLNVLSVVRNLAVECKCHQAEKELIKNIKVKNKESHFAK